MKRKILTVVMIIVFFIVMISSLSVVEFYYAKKTERIPLIALRREDKVNQYFEYNALFYRVYKCYSDEVSIRSYKESLPSCPRLIMFDNNGEYTTPSGVSISKRNYQMLLTVNGYKEIDKFNEEEYKNALFVAEEYGRSIHVQAAENNKIVIDEETVNVEVFREFVITDVYGNYKWVPQYNNKEYYKCAKVENGIFLFSDYNDGKCSSNWATHNFGSKWCSLAKDSNKEEIKLAAEEFCK